MTRAEYKPTQVHVVKALKIKLAYYAVLLLMVTFEFIFAAGNFLLYRIMGFTIDLP